MNNFFVMNFPGWEYDIETIQDIFKQIEQILPEESSLLMLPELVSLKRYDKEELIELLKIYTNYLEGLINE